MKNRPDMRRPGNQLDLQELLEALARAEPTPAGGAAAALVVSQGAALGLMVVRIASKGETRSGVATIFRDAEAALQRVYHDAWPLFDEDTQAYDALRQASKGAARDESVYQSALVRAVEVPLRVLGLAAHGLTALSAVSAFVRPALLCDAAAGARLMRAGAEISRANVRYNTASLADHEEARRNEERARQACEVARAAHDEILSRLESGPKI